MEWLLVGIFFAPHNTHEVLERFATQQECIRVKTMFIRSSEWKSGLKGSGVCIKVKKRGN